MSTSPASPGCLSEAQIQDVQEAPPGGVPEDLARHLAGCDACQQRLLFGASARPARPASRALELPSPGRALLLALAVLVALGLFLYSLLKLSGRVG